MVRRKTQGQTAVSMSGKDSNSHSNQWVENCFKTVLVTREHLGMGEIGSALCAIHNKSHTEQELEYRNTLTRTRENTNKHSYNTYVKKIFLTMTQNSKPFSALDHTSQG